MKFQPYDDMSRDDLIEWICRLQSDNREFEAERLRYGERLVRWLCDDLNERHVSLAEMPDDGEGPGTWWTPLPTDKGPRELVQEFENYAIDEAVNYAESRYDG